MAGLFTPAPPGVDPFTSALNNLAQGFLGAQDIYGKRQTQEAHTALYKVQTDLERAKLAREQQARDEDARIQAAKNEAFARIGAIGKQNRADFVGPADPGLTMPTAFEALAAGIDPEKYGKAFNVTTAMDPNSNADQLRRGLVATGKPASNNESVNSLELAKAQEAELEKVRQQTLATLGAAQIRGPSGGAAPMFTPVDTQDGLYMQDRRTGALVRATDPTTGQPLMGKAGSNDLPNSEQTKIRNQMSAVDQLTRAIADYEKSLKTDGFMVQDMTEKGSKQRALFNQIRMGTKDLYGLGAPQAGDIQILAEALPGHSDVSSIVAYLSGSFGGDGAQGRQLARVSELKNMAARIRTQLDERMSQGKAYRGEGAAPLRILTPEARADADQALADNIPPEEVEQRLREKGYDPSPILAAGGRK